MIRNYPTEVAESVMLILSLALLTWILIDGDTFLAAIIGFMVGLKAADSSRSLYQVIWMIFNRNDDESRS
jgi:hypothetical protein